LTGPFPPLISSIAFLIDFNMSPASPEITFSPSLTGALPLVSLDWAFPFVCLTESDPTIDSIFLPRASFLISLAGA